MPRPRDACPARAGTPDARRAAQLALDLGLRPGRTFANFAEGPNELAVAAVRARARGACYLWGPAGTGKTHLLEAACAEAARAIYLPMRRLRESGAEVLTDLSRIGLVLVDDVDAIAGDRGWEQAVFHLYNEVESSGGTFVATGGAPPRALDLELPDLRSRLGAGLVVQLRPISDEDRRRALMTRAGQMGFDLPVEVLDFLLHRCSRDLHDLFGLLEVLDRSSLAARRKLSVPFVKTVLDQSAPR